MPDERNILDLTIEQARCLTSPFRHQVLDVIRAEPGLSAAEVTTRIGAKERLVYYHVKELLKAGLICVTGTRPGKTKSESLYAAVAEGFRWACDPTDPAAAEVERKKFRLIVNRLIRDSKNVSWGSNDAALSAVRRKLTREKRAELRRKLAELSAWIADNDDPSGEEIAFTAFMYSAR